MNGDSHYNFSGQMPGILNRGGFGERGITIPVPVPAVTNMPNPWNPNPSPSGGGTQQSASPVPYGQQPG